MYWCGIMTSQQAIAIANQTAQRQGYSLSDYQTPRAVFSTDSVAHWIVGYEDLSGLPGEVFFVSVDDATSASSFHIGY